MAGLQRPRSLNKSCFLLIVLAGVERFAFKGVASNLVTYLTDIVKMSNSAAAKTVNNWCGFTSMLPLLVASLADSCWPRYPTIMTSSTLYVLGLVSLTATTLSWTWYPTNHVGSSFLFWSLCIISLGQGVYNPSLQAFAADQLEDVDDELASTKQDHRSGWKTFFFQCWYFGVCGGSLLGVTVMSYIEDTFGWVLGFAIPTLAMVASVWMFCFGNRICVYRQRDTDIADQKFLNGNLLRAMKESIKRLMDVDCRKTEVVELELEEKALCPKDSVKESGSIPRSQISLNENTRIVLRLLPIWTMLLMFAVIFQQPATFFTKQGMTMQRSITKKFMIPPATLQSAITISIILLMPLYDAVLIPFTRLITRNHKGINVTQRMGVGMVLSIIAMVIAAIVETKRLEVSKQARTETVPVSIFCLLPQYILLGISDIFTVVGMQEFFYSQVPVRMKTLGIALYTSVFGVGSFVSSLLISTVEFFTHVTGQQSWFCDDMSESRLDKYYWLLAFLSSLSFLFYVVLCKWYNNGTPTSTSTCTED